MYSWYISLKFEFRTINFFILNRLIKTILVCIYLLYIVISKLLLQVSDTELITRCCGLFELYTVIKEKKTIINAFQTAAVADVDLYYCLSPTQIPHLASVTNDSWEFLHSFNLSLQNTCLLPVAVVCGH